MTGYQLNIIVPAVAALGAALIAGISSYLVGRGMRSHDWRLSLTRDRILDRRQIYARFLAGADALMLRSADNRAQSVDELLPLFAIVAEISLIAPDSVSGPATRLCDVLLESLKPEVGKEGDYFSAKSAFVKAARDDLLQLEQLR